MGPFKIHVYPETSRIVQELLFMLGYSWINGYKRVIQMDKPWLLFDGEHLTYGMSGRNDRGINKELTIEDLRDGRLCIGEKIEILEMVEDNNG